MTVLIGFSFSSAMGIWNNLVAGNSAVVVFLVPSRSGEAFEASLLFNEGLVLEEKYLSLPFCGSLDSSIMWLIVSLSGMVDVLEVVLGDYYSLSLCRFRSTFLTWYVPKLTRVPSKEVGTI